MLNKFNLLTLFLIAASSLIAVSGSEISTLFTTPQERQLINSNRYKLDEVQPQLPINVDEPTIGGIPQLVRKYLRESITISGITLSNSGPNIVWINSQVYEDGASMDNNMRIKVMSGSKLKVRVTAPDGKHYFATSGETIEIVYSVVVEN
jgi:hypothetical protein